MPARILIDFYKDDISTDLSDAFPGNDKFCIPSEKRTELSGTRDDECKKTAAAGIDIHIIDTSEGAAGADIDHFFLSEFTYTHEFLAKVSGIGESYDGWAEFMYVVFIDSFAQKNLQ